MSNLIKKIISIVIVAVFIFLAYLAFSSSLNNDSYIHFLKDSYKKDISGINLQFVGFEGKFVSSERDITSRYENYPVIYYLLEYQSYVCRSSGDGQSCGWETYKTESDSTPFSLSVNNVQVDIRENGQAEFTPKNSEIFDETSSHRVVQSVIKKSDPIYMWGYLENSEVKMYNDDEHKKQVLIVTDNARQTLVDSISGVLYLQILSAGIIVLMSIILVLVNKNWKEKSYIAKNYPDTKNRNI